MNRALNPITPAQIKAELQKRHDAGAKTGEDRLNLDALEYIAELESELAAYKDALQELCDEQNGPPLLRREKQWQAAMDKADGLLSPKPARPKKDFEPIPLRKDKP